jgi:hypothetical protein
MIAHLLYRVLQCCTKVARITLGAPLPREVEARPFFNHYAFPKFAVMVVNHSHWLVDS